MYDNKSLQVLFICKMNIYTHNWLLAFKFINICNEFRYMLIECKTDTFFYALFLNPDYKCGATQTYLNPSEISRLPKTGIELKPPKTCKIL